MLSRSMSTIPPTEHPTNIFQIKKTINHISGNIVKTVCWNIRVKRSLKLTKGTKSVTKGDFRGKMVMLHELHTTAEFFFTRLQQIAMFFYFLLSFIHVL